MCTVLRKPNTEWKNVLFFSFQDSFNQVITGKNIETVFMVLSTMSTYKDMMYPYKDIDNKPVTNLKTYLHYILKVTSYIHIL